MLICIDPSTLKGTQVFCIIKQFELSLPFHLVENNSIINKVEFRCFAVKFFPGHENRKSLMMSPGLLPIVCSASGSGRSALLTINLPQTEILTYQIFIYAIYIRESYWVYFLLHIHPHATELRIPQPSFLLLLWIPLLSVLMHPWLPSMSVCHWELCPGLHFSWLAMQFSTVHHYPLNTDLP